MRLDQPATLEEFSLFLYALKSKFKFARAAVKPQVVYIGNMLSFDFENKRTGPLEARPGDFN